MTHALLPLSDVMLPDVAVFSVHKIPHNQMSYYYYSSSIFYTTIQYILVNIEIPNFNSYTTSVNLIEDYTTIPCTKHISLSQCLLSTSSYLGASNLKGPAISHVLITFNSLQVTIAVLK